MNGKDSMNGMDLVNKLSERNRLIDCYQVVGIGHLYSLHRIHHRCHSNDHRIDFG